MTASQIAAALRAISAKFSRESRDPAYHFEYEPGELAYLLDTAAKALEAKP